MTRAVRSASAMGTHDDGKKVIVSVLFRDEEEKRDYTEDVTLVKEGIPECEREEEKAIINKIMNDRLFQPFKFLRLKVLFY